jgi:hypothetical protein
MDAWNALTMAVCGIGPRFDRMTYGMWYPANGLVPVIQTIELEGVQNGSQLRNLLLKEHSVIKTGGMKLTEKEQTMKAFEDSMAICSGLASVSMRLGHEIRIHAAMREEKLVRAFIGIPGHRCDVLEWLPRASAEALARIDSETQGQAELE